MVVSAGLAGENASVLRVLQRQRSHELQLQAVLGLHSRLHLLSRRQPHADGAPVSRLEISACPAASWPIYRSVCVLVCLLAYLSVCLCARLPPCLSVCVLVCLDLYLSTFVVVCLLAYPSVYLSASMCICLPVWSSASLTVRVTSFVH